KTATTYEDLGVLSCDPDLGADLSELFNHLTGYSRQGEYRRLLVAPMHLRDALRDLIRGQAHAGGRIAMKMNSLVDSEMIDELYAASRAGAQIELVVRSICCLRPGVPGLSENIAVRSVVGRYLEHSRVFRFGEPGADETEYIIGSADLMPRNLDRRVEAMLRVADPRMRARLDEVLTINVLYDALAWRLEPSGNWTKVDPTGGEESQVKFQDLALARAKVRSSDA
ncbi:MAG TPA: RNA degradosome polyphosphate kinase, partial [Acidimicrobiia bacterium]|nr:RNA degradosome polyphosphate kinase [Acidimicrobiia bacterium]